MHCKLFGDDFIFGVSSSAAQIEGAHLTDGKGLSIWDVFSTKKKKILNGDTPFTATDFYHRYKEDILLIKEMGFKQFRFSISWPRILPDGIGEINQKGILFYHDVINECIKNGIEPWVTLYHWDLPQGLEDKGGWTNREITNWFKNYVEICVNEYHKKVKHWMVLNEPMVFTGAGYFLGAHAPGRKGISNFAAAIHHAVLCQAIGFKAIKSIDKEAKVGTTFSCSYVTPYSNSLKDINAANRVNTLLNRIFIEPSLGLGYPDNDLPVLKKINNYILPGDDQLMKVNFDFIGIQVYTREVVKHNWLTPYVKAKIVSADKRKVYRTLMDWEVHPESIYQMIKLFSSYSSVKEIYITENGASFPDELEGISVHDNERKNFFESYLKEVLRAKKEGMNIKGYFVWSLTDNFEWAEGYRQRFGLVYIDYATQKRILKNSGKWFKGFLQSY
jgi:beta-glucosidase